MHLAGLGSHGEQHMTTLTQHRRDVVRCPSAIGQWLQRTAHIACLRSTRVMMATETREPLLCTACPLRDFRLMKQANLMKFDGHDLLHLHQWISQEVAYGNRYSA